MTVLNNLKSAVTTLNKSLTIRQLLLLTFFLFGFSNNSYNQTAYHHISDKRLYNFIDDLATQHIIDVTTAIKPYSRVQTANMLKDAKSQYSELSLAQQRTLDYYLHEFSMELNELKTSKLRLLHKEDSMSFHLLTPELTYKDSLFRFQLRPVYGFRHFSGGNKDFWVTYGGAEVVSYVGNNWSVYASLRDNYQSGQRLSQPKYFTQELGGNYKSLTGGGPGGEFSEMRAGITYSWDWGSFGLLKDHVQWGDNQNGSNIFSGRTPSYPMIKLYMNPTKWLEFNYYHGWLVSQAIDSSRSIFPPDRRARTVQRTKYIAANMFTLKPLERLHISLGNSIVYGDMDVQPAYLIPFAFYKSIVHSTHWRSSFQNNAMFFNISSRQIKHLHLYATYFIDEFSIRRVGDPDRYNFTSFKAGFNLSAWPIRNISVAAEYTYSSPICFLHDEPTTSFESNLYNLGHYLTDNAEEYYGSVTWHAIDKLWLTASYVYAKKGNYYEYIRGMRDPRIDELPVLDDIIWDKKSLSFELMYLPLNNLRVFAKYSISSINGYDADGFTGQDYLDMFTPYYKHGDNNILELGFGLGF